MSFNRFRSLPSTFSVLSRLDMPGRTVLHSIHNAPMYNQRGQVPILEVPHEVRQEQVQAKSNLEDNLRLATIDSHESTPKPNVFQSEYCTVKQKWPNVNDERCSRIRVRYS